uniref:Tetratricopeptide repeat-containing protein n=1 Tax=Candidatus Kentrum sp. TUN TaxID=2126343 RepID=A0A450ZKS2_9GAMM|nr:MAG: Tetratricopeptide repeat-containing protein [Candidatus Kentron sp. TUN]VFK54403.1 MAG: Tetratricopeptide repeat-containing protein [Candidatus Kentron sp. TUN]VFK55475.1 MAG: Tetratricopeptide repeat-containing protein [Candidatus Kentron sp. TUN]
MEQGRLTEADDVLHELPTKRQMDSDVIEFRIRIKFSRIANANPAEVNLEDRLVKDPSNYEAYYQLGARRVVKGDYEAAMGYFLEIMRRDRKFQDDAERKGLVDVFSLIGDTSDPLVSHYRSLMSSILY